MTVRTEQPMLHLSSLIAAALFSIDLVANTTPMLAATLLS